MDCSLPVSSVLHYLQEFAQTNVHWAKWCHPIISSSVVPFSSCPQSFLASWSVPKSQLFAWGGQNTEASAIVLPMNIQGWYPLGLTSLISVQSKGLSKSFLTPQFESISSSVLSPLCGPTLTSIHDYWKDHNFHYMDFFGKVMSLLFNVMSRFVIAFLLSSKCLLTSWPQSTGPWTHLFLHELNPWL